LGAARFGIHYRAGRGDLAQGEKMKFIFCILLSLTLFGCASDALKVEKTDNAGINAELLFKKDGFSVYRFYDGTRAVYYVVPQGQAQTVYSENCGKGCSREVRTESQTLPPTNTNRK
jgi:hypothetical protein